MAEPRSTIETSGEHSRKRFTDARAVVEAITAGELKPYEKVILPGELTPDDLFSFTGQEARQEIGLFKNGDGALVLLVGSRNSMHRTPESFVTDYFLHTHPGEPTGAVSSRDIDTAVTSRTREFMADAGGVVEYTRPDVSQYTDPFTGKPIVDFERFRHCFFAYQDLGYQPFSLNNSAGGRLQALTGTTFNRVERWDAEGMAGFMAYINGTADSYVGTTMEARWQHFFEGITAETADQTTLASCIIEVAALDFPLLRLGQLEFYQQLLAAVPQSDLSQLVAIIRTTADAAERQTILIDFMNTHKVLIPGIMGAQLTAKDIDINTTITASLAEAQYEVERFCDDGDPTAIFLTIEGADLHAIFTKANKSYSVDGHIESTAIAVMLDKALMLWQLKTK